MRVRRPLVRRNDIGGSVRAYLAEELGVGARIMNVFNIPQHPRILNECEYYQPNIKSDTCAITPLVAGCAPFVSWPDGSSWSPDVWLPDPGLRKADEAGRSFVGV